MTTREDKRKTKHNAHITDFWCLLSSISTTGADHNTSGIVIMKSISSTSITIFSLFLTVAASAVTVANAANIDIAWSIRAYPDEVAQVGDTITFTWASGHNVNIHPAGSCDETGAIFVGGSSPATYTFTEDDVGKDLFFACDVGEHCEFEQHVLVSVSAPSGTVAPSSAPAAVEEPGAPSAASTSTTITSGISISTACTMLMGTVVSSGWLLL